MKYKLDDEKGVYRIAHILPSGMVFPFDFGSIPGTLADDGDPLDLLVLAEAGTFPGCLVTVRLIGGIQARQTQDGRTQRNDRLLGVADGIAGVLADDRRRGRSRQACSTRSSISSCPERGARGAGSASFAASARGGEAAA